MAITINELRASFIWSETIVSPLRAATPANQPLSFVADSTFYERGFEQLRDGNPLRPKPDMELALPWPRPEGQRFWYNYLERETSLDQTSGQRARKSLVPLRWPVPWQVTGANWPGPLALEVFIHPHGLALVVNAFLVSQQRSLADVTTVLRELYDQPQLRVAWPEGAQENVSLRTLADLVLRRTRQLLGAGGLESIRMALEPFSIVTPVIGDQVLPEQLQRIDSGGEIHRTLHALVYWSADAGAADLTPLGEAAIETRTGEPGGHIIYGSARGRAIWLPARFKTPAKLRCYHRNLTYAMLQIESLGGLLVTTADMINRGEHIEGPLRTCARHAAGIVGRLAGNTPKMYHSRSVLRYIERHQLNEPRELILRRL